MSNLTSINPINNSIVGTYPEHTNEEINKIIYEVNDSFNLWKSLQIEQRCQYFKQLSIALKSRKNEFANLMALEMGKPISQGEAEVEKSAWVCDYYADNAPEFLSTKPPLLNKSQLFAPSGLLNIGGYQPVVIFCNVIL